MNRISDENGYRYAALHLAEKGTIGQTVVYTGGTYTRRLSRYPELVICGAGHVALALSTIAQSVDFTVTVIDDRSEFAENSRFGKNVTVICDNFEHALRALPGTYRWYAVMTRGHKDDETCVKNILKGTFMYVGMMGSRAKIAYARERLLNEGCTREQLDAIHTPIGLAIGAQTPQEIAVSIAAELVQERSKLGCTYLDAAVYDALLYDRKKMTVATIIKKEGSAPRGAGSCLATDCAGQVYGTVGGGSIEAAVISEAAGMKTGCEPFVKSYGLSSSDASGLGMVCGGTVTVLFEHVPPLE